MAKYAPLQHDSDFDGLVCNLDDSEERTAGFVVKFSMIAIAMALTIAGAYAIVAHTWQPVVEVWAVVSVPLGAIWHKYFGT